jgi:hypothetical protein
MGRLLVVLALPAATVALVASVLGREAPIQGSTLEATAIAWGGRVFTNPQSFDVWLRARGTSYEAWTENHPGLSPWEPEPTAAARRRVAEAAPPPRRQRAPSEAAPREPAREASSQPRREAAPAAKPPPAERTAAPSTPDETSDGLSATMTLFVMTVVALALGFLTLSLMPPMWYVRRVQHAAILVDRRVEVAVLGLALLMGLAIPMFLPP